MLDDNITDGEIYCRVGFPKKGILMIDDKIVEMDISFDKGNKNVYIAFDGLNDKNHCGCAMGRESYRNQQNVLQNTRNGKMFFPHSYCGYCSKKFPPRENYLIKLLDVQESVDENKRSKNRGKRTRGSKKNKGDSV